jgi:hypothetical protein
LIGASDRKRGARHVRARRSKLETVIDEKVTLTRDGLRDECCVVVAHQAPRAIFARFLAIIARCGGRAGRRSIASRFGHASRDNLPKTHNGNRACTGFTDSSTNANGEASGSRGTPSGL